MEISFYENWIKNGSNYSDACSFYNEHGTNNTLKALFNKAETPYTRTKLAFEIKAIGNIPVPVTVDQSIPSDFKLYRQSKKRVDPDKLPDSLKAEWFKLGPLWGETRFLHSRLDTLQTDAGRLEYALKIIELGEQRREIFNKIDFFIENGKELTTLQEKIKEVVEPIPNESAEIKIYKLKEERARLRVQRSKMKKQPHRQLDLNKVNDRLTEIEKELTNGAI